LSSHTCSVVLLQPMVLIASTKFTRRLSRSFFFSFFLLSARCPLSRHRHKKDGQWYTFFILDWWLVRILCSYRSFLIGIIDEILLCISLYKNRLRSFSIINLIIVVFHWRE
jgi:hypothetical protein